ncbi:MAG: TolC family protein [Saprospiraceae bacterium]
MKSGPVFLFIFLLFHPDALSQQERSLDFFLQMAYEHSPILNEIFNQQKINNLKNDLTFAQYKKPYVEVTGDFLFAPYFLHNKNIVSVTPNPDENAFGYDHDISNGGLYALLLNASIPLFKTGTINTINFQNFVQNQTLQHQIGVEKHDLDKSVTDQYILTYQIQQLLQNLQTISTSISERKKLVEALVQTAILPQSEFQLLDIELSIRNNEYLQQRVVLSDALMTLNNLCGILDTSLYELTLPEIKLNSLNNSFSFLEKYRLDSLSILSDQEIFNLKYKPQLDAFGNSGINTASAIKIPHSIGFSAGVHLSIPLYDGEQRKIVYQQNKLLLDNLKAYKNQTWIQKQNSLAYLTKQIELTRLSLAGFNDQLKKQEALLETLKNKVIHGQGSVTDYRLALQDYLSTNQNIIQTQSNLWLLINQYNYVNW